VSPIHTNASRKLDTPTFKSLVYQVVGFGVWRIPSFCVLIRVDPMCKDANDLRTDMTPASSIFSDKIPPAAYGDVDGDNVLDRIPPITLEENLANITSTPPLTHLAWWIHINDADLRYWYVPIGSANEQFALYILLLLVPILTALGSVYMYHQSFYQVKHNKFGILDKGTIIPIAVKQGFYEGKA
jgi:hypothetical protein